MKGELPSSHTCLFSRLFPQEFGNMSVNVLISSRKYSYCVNSNAYCVNSKEYCFCVNVLILMLIVDPCFNLMLIVYDFLELLRPLFIYVS